MQNDDKNKPQDEKEGPPEWNAWERLKAYGEDGRQAFLSRQPLHAPAHLTPGSHGWFAWRGGWYAAQQASQAGQQREAYAQELHKLLDQSLGEYLAEVARLRPGQDTTFNEGWLARTHALPRRHPLTGPLPFGWLAGWDMADDSPRTAWAAAKQTLLAPLPDTPPSATNNHLL